MRGDEIGAALINNAVDAAVLWEPWLSKTVELSNANVLATSRDYPVFADVLIAKKGFIQGNKNKIETLKKIWGEAAAAYVSDKKSFVRAVAPLVGLTDQELDWQLNKIKFFDGSPEAVSNIRAQIREMIG
jgi:NitT/TauT family transport system substrate-binding protein